MHIEIDLLLVLPPTITPLKNQSILKVLASFHQIDMFLKFVMALK